MGKDPAGGGLRVISIIHACKACSSFQVDAVSTLFGARQLLGLLACANMDHFHKQTPVILH